jgi:hypothetical protein
MDRDEVCRRPKRAIQKLTDRDRELLKRDVNERSITHSLAMYLQEQFSEMAVDCEYNRDHDNVKKLLSYPRTVRADDTDAKTVFPDIIVHKGGTNAANLLVIEAKKVANPRRKDKDSDREKLNAFKGDTHLKYEHAVFLEFRTRDDDPGVECPEFIA